MHQDWCEQTGEPAAGRDAKGFSAPFLPQMLRPGLYTAREAKRMADLGEEDKLGFDFKM